jgi:hypothetical protein
MKTNTKRLLSIMLCLAMVLAMLPMAVFAADETVTLYVQPNANWKQSNARFAAYFFETGKSDKWVSCTAVEGADGIYAVEVPAGYTNIIFCRMNPGNSTNSWNNRWNQTSDLKVPTNGTNCYVVAPGTWDKGAGSWTEFTPDGGVGTTEAIVNKYHIVGSMNEWSKSDSNMMTDNGDGTWSITMDLTAGSYTYKVTDTMGMWYPDGMGTDLKLTVATDGAVTFTFDVATKTTVATGDCLGEVEPEPEIPAGSFFAVGTHNSWTNPDADYIMVAGEEGIYTLTLAVEAGKGALKVTDGTWDNSWGGNGADGNYEYFANEAGEIVVTFDSNTKTVTVTGDILGDVPVVTDPIPEGSILNVKGTSDAPQGTHRRIRRYRFLSRLIS